MKIAIIALPHPDEPVVTPPLPIGYLAALIEQQRHIVRIYDLALAGNTPQAEALAPLRAFRPHVAVVVSNDQAALAMVEELVRGLNTIVMPLGADLRITPPGAAIAQALWWLDKRARAEDERSVIYEAIFALDTLLDALPFPARHLLQLEQYPLRTPNGELQTPILIGQQNSAGAIFPRSPTQIIAEIRSVAREYGIRHFVLGGPPLSANREWLHDLLYHLTTSDLGIGWEGVADYNALSGELLPMCRRAGCEALCLPFDGIDVLGSKKARQALSAVVEQAHSLDIAIRAHIHLDPTYAAMPTLVDISGTFGIDDVRFSVMRAGAPEQPKSDGIALESVAEMVQSRYRSSRSRQFFVDRFGPRMGPMLWRVGRAGLLGRTWQRYAVGGEETGGTIARGYSA